MKKNIVVVCDTKADKCKRRIASYTHVHINTMRNMLIAANAEYDQLVVLTNEDPALIHSDFQVIPLEEDLNPHFHEPLHSKLQMFNSDLPIQGEVLYIDLDCIPMKGINKLWSIDTNNKIAIRGDHRMDPGSAIGKLVQSSIDSPTAGVNKYNTSIMKFQHGSMDFVYKLYKESSLLTERSSSGIDDERFVCQCIEKHNYPVTPILNDLVPLYQTAINNQTKSNKPTVTADFIPEQSSIPDHIAAILFIGSFKPWNVLKYDKTIRDLYQ